MGLSAQQTNLSSVTKTAQLEEFTRKWEDGAVKSDALDSTITNNRFVETKYLATSSTVNNKTVEDSSVPASTTLNNTEDLKKFDAVTSGSSTVANDAKDGSIYSGWFYGSSTKALDGTDTTNMSLKTADAKKTIDYTTGVKTADASAEELVRINPVNSRMATDAKGATVTTETEDAITQKRISGGSVVNGTIDTATAREAAKTATVAELTGGTYKANDADKVLTSVTSTDTSGDILKDLAYGTATSTAYDSTTTDLKGNTDYTANSSYTSTETDCTCKKADINALTAATVSWTANNNDFAGITDMAGKVTTDVATLCTADIKTDIFGLR